MLSFMHLMQYAVMVESCTTHRLEDLFYILWFYISMIYDTVRLGLLANNNFNEKVRTTKIP